MKKCSSKSCHEPIVAGQTVITLYQSAAIGKMIHVRVTKFDPESKAEDGKAMFGSYDCAMDCIRGWMSTSTTSMKRSCK